jgi:hypothetical protein
MGYSLEEGIFTAETQRRGERRRVPRRSKSKPEIAEEAETLFTNKGSLWLRIAAEPPYGASVSAPSVISSVGFVFNLI